MTDACPHHEGSRYAGCGGERYIAEERYRSGETHRFREGPRGDAEGLAVRGGPLGIRVVLSDDGPNGASYAAALMACREHAAREAGEPLADRRRSAYEEECAGAESESAESTVARAVAEAVATDCVTRGDDGDRHRFAPKGDDADAGRSAPVVDEMVTRSHGRHLGVTKWFSDRLGYGFITKISGESKGTDLFVHFSSVRPLNNTHRTLHKGEYVSFDVGENNGGVQAVFVTGVMGGPLMCDHAEPPPADDVHLQLALAKKREPPRPPAPCGGPRAPTWIASRAPGFAPASSFAPARAPESFAAADPS